MAHITYHGGGNGQNAELEAAKVESLKLANELARTKLQKLQGELVSKKLVAYLTSNALAALRENVSRLPGLVTGELRTTGLSQDHLRAVRVNAENAVHRFLEELSEDMEKVIHSEEFLAGFDDDSEVKDDHAETARELKRETINRTRREKYAAKVGR